MISRSPSETPRVAFQSWPHARTLDGQYAQSVSWIVRWSTSAPLLSRCAGAIHMNPILAPAVPMQTICAMTTLHYKWLFGQYAGYLQCVMAKSTYTFVRANPARPHPPTRGDPAQSRVGQDQQAHRGGARHLRAGRQGAHLPSPRTLRRREPG